MLAAASQLLRFTVEGEAASAGTAVVPSMFDIATVVVRPAASRMTTGMLLMQVPLGVTVKLPPLEVTSSGRTLSPVKVLDTL